MLIYWVVDKPLVDRIFLRRSIYFNHCPSEADIASFNLTGFRPIVHRYYVLRKLAHATNRDF